MTALSPIEPQSLRKTLSCFPTGVAIVTTAEQGAAPVGLTISSFNSVSMSPALVLWSLSLQAATLPVFRASDGFTINVLAAEQIDLAQIFASPVEERFRHGEWTKGPNSFPVLKGAAATISCRSYAHYDGGDHEIIVGEVISHEASDHIPLVYGKGRLAPLLEEV